MRFKFKAWSYTDKKWYDRVLAGCDSEGSDAVCHCVYSDEHGDWVNFDEFCGVVVQWTGLKDKKGKEIYEGDIVSARVASNTAGFTGYVHYLNAQYWVNYIGYESYYQSLIYLHGAEYEPIEVIGNIYSNKELLEVVSND